jgi:hypothetical protein
MYVHHTIIRRLFLLYAQSLRSIACFAGPFLRRERRPSLFTLFCNDHILLTYYRLAYYRWAEIGDITTDGSHYEGSGTSERSERYCWYHPPSIFTYGPFLRRPFLSIWFLMFERFIIDWKIDVREISVISWQLVFQFISLDHREL